MSINTTSFKHVSYLWNEEEAAKLAGDEVALLIYRSNLLGADLRLTNYGGGNTSCKTVELDPLTKEPVEVMWIKGSGGDNENIVNICTYIFQITKKFLHYGLEYVGTIFDAHG